MQILSQNRTELNPDYTANYLTSPHTSRASNITIDTLGVIAHLEIVLYFVYVACMRGIQICGE